MNSSEVLDLYTRSGKVREISQKLFSGATPFICLKGLTGSSAAFVAAATAHNLDEKRTHLFILNDKEEAAFFLNDLEMLAGEKQVLFFPSSYKRPYQVEETDNANILLRAEVLSGMLQPIPGGSRFIVTYPEALTEKVVTRSHLGSNTLSIKQGEKLSVEFITETLAAYGFRREDFVIEPGQFSVRGGIIDVFSFANDYPYRIELFGEDVETLRSFDPVTQLSVKKVPSVTIIPNIEDKLLMESRQSFFEYLAPDSILWIADLELAGDRISSEYANAERIFAGKQEGSIFNHLVPAELFITGADFSAQTRRFPLLLFKDPGSIPCEQVPFNASPQPAFNKNFDLLKEYLRANNSAGIRNIIFADTAKQIERLHAIFGDIAPGEQLFTPINSSLSGGFIDKDLKLACLTDHQIFERYHRFRLKNAFYKKKEALTLKELRELRPGDYVTHIDHGIGRFGGLEKVEVNGKLQETIRLVYKDNDILYVSINSLHRVAKYAGKEGAVPKIDKLGSASWQNLKNKTKKKVKEIAFDLIRLYAKRKATSGFAFSPDNYLQNELEASFIYEDTPDQVKATADVKRDMESGAPMDRLVCGDVGFGKTEVAIRAAFKAVNDSKQVAVLVPTTILALQHFKTFSERLKGFPVTVDYINRFKSARQQKETLQKLAEGKIDIIIGTHRLVNADVKFKDLGLLVIDEEQKFGVGVKERLKLLKSNVDTLTLTATPIPRTLQFSMLGARDLSIINTPPPNRYPVQTEVHNYNEEIVRDAIRYEMARGGQVFFVHNRVQNIFEIAGMVQRLCPDARVAVGHGQMKGDQLEKVMVDFIEGAYDVLVCTAIVESGLDIANANTMIINDAQNFGLSDLHQLRGRVGRTNKKAFCYLLVPSHLTLTDEARKRLKAIEDFSDLGSGFSIAMRDLDIRGAGDLLGAEQSGFISDIGYEMYQKILDEAIQELREEMQQGDGPQPAFREGAEAAASGRQPIVKDCSVDTDLEILIPDKYVSNITERLSLYKELDESKTEEDLQRFLDNLIDRFGQVPKETQELINTVRLRWLAMRSGFEKLILKNGKMICHFVNNQQSPFYQSRLFTDIIAFVQKHPRECSMKEVNNKLTLTFGSVHSVSDAISHLSKLNPQALEA
ncbi:MAG: transcription-repair coupling factor [Bacteroidota bacterium]